MKFAFPTLQDEPGVDVDIELSDFGAPVDVTPPPADEVQDLSALAGNGTFGGSSTGSGMIVLGSSRSSVRVVGFASSRKTAGK